jgi:DNA/RNA endonuclease YhcR with UshA esterase domain
VGKTVKITGQVQSVSQTNTGSIEFINFKGNARGQFVAIVKKDHQTAVAAAFASDLKGALEGKAVEVTGTVVLFQQTPQIEVTKPEQVRLAP